MKTNSKWFCTTLSTNVDSKTQLEGQFFTSYSNFSDFNHYEKFNKSITNESYRKMERDPVPIHFEEAINQLVEENKISLGKRRLPCGKIMNRYFSLNEPEIDLSKEELDVINRVIRKISHLNRKQIGEYSLADAPVKMTDDGEIVDCGLVSSRNSNEKAKVYVKIS